MDVRIDSTKNKLYASPVEDSNITVIITNLGTSEDNFVVNVDTTEASDWFSIGVNRLSLVLQSGESGSVVSRSARYRDIAGGSAE